MYFAHVFVGEQFDRIPNELCFICGEPALTAEHVPPDSIGGRKLLNSCQQCNNELGTRIDEPFSQRVLQSYRGRFLDPTRTMPGARRVDIHLGVDENRAITHVGTSFDHDPDLVAVTKGGGRFELMFTKPDDHAVQCGLLKSCYLAESALVGRPLAGPRATTMRSELSSILSGNAPNASSLGEVVVIYAATSAPDRGKVRPSYAVGRVESEPATMPLISYGRYACEPVFMDDPGLAEIVSEWPPADDK